MPSDFPWAAKMQLRASRLKTHQPPSAAARSSVEGPPAPAASEVIEVDGPARRQSPRGAGSSRRRSRSLASVPLVDSKTTEGAAPAGAEVALGGPDVSRRRSPPSRSRSLASVLLTDSETAVDGFLRRRLARRARAKVFRALEDAAALEALWRRAAAAPGDLDESRLARALRLQKKALEELSSAVGAARQ